jgi:hypothetical protein
MCMFRLERSTLSPSITSHNISLVQVCIVLGLASAKLAAEIRTPPAHHWICGSGTCTWTFSPRYNVKTWSTSPPAHHADTPTLVLPVHILAVRHSSTCSKSRVVHNSRTVYRPLSPVWEFPLPSDTQGGYQSVNMVLLLVSGMYLHLNGLW